MPPTGEVNSPLQHQTVPLPGAPMHRGAPRTRPTSLPPRPIRGLFWLLNGPARRGVGATRGVSEADKGNSDSLVFGAATTRAAGKAVRRLTGWRASPALHPRLRAAHVHAGTRSHDLLQQRWVLFQQAKQFDDGGHGGNVAAFVAAEYVVAAAG